MIFDVDGVLTDGTLYFSETGAELKAFNAQDGQGLKMLKRERSRSRYSFRASLARRRTARTGARHNAGRTRRKQKERGFRKADQPSAHHSRRCRVYGRRLGGFAGARPLRFRGKCARCAGNRASARALRHTCCRRPWSRSRTMRVDHACARHPRAGHRPSACVRPARHTPCCRLP